MANNGAEILEQYKTEHLFLLVGTNPLPNLVSALLLAKNVPKIYLLYSCDTSKYKDNLIAVLKTKLEEMGLSTVEIIPLCPVKESEPSDIYSKVNGYYNEKLSTVDSSKIGLNYTGGTKAMAVHAYRALKYQKDPTGKITERYPVLTYLDARTLSMMVEHEYEPSTPIRVVDAVKINLKDMLALHDYCYLQNNQNKEIEPKHENIFEGLIEPLKNWGLSNIKNYWNEINSKVIEINNSKEIKDKNQEKTLLKESWKVPSEIFSDSTTLGDLANKLGTTVEYLLKYLNGIWLEDYVLHCLIEIDKDIKFSDFGMNVQIIPKNSKRKTVKDNNKIPGQYEIDDYAIRGYQLFAISCSITTDPKELKQKFYQIYVHAKQMGGDEARVGFVCGLKVPEELEREIILEWQAEDKVKVFGLGSIPKLENELKNWITETGGYT